MQAPIYYNELNILRGQNLSFDDMFIDSATFRYFQRSLYQRLASRFDFTVPEAWDKDVFKCVLIMMGFAGIFDTSKFQHLNNDTDFGILPLPASVQGLGIQMQPIKIITASPYFKMTEAQTIYKEAGLIKLTPDYIGLMDIVDQYATKLALLFSSMDQSIQNSRFFFAMAANTKAGANALQWIMDKRNSGKPFIVFNEEYMKKINPKPLENEKDPWSFIDFEIGKNYITDKLLMDYRNIMCQFDSEIGIPNNPHEKAERLISNEVESNSAETVARFETWMECLQDSIKKTIEVFPELDGQLAVKAKVYNTGQTGAVEAGGGFNGIS